MLGASSLRSGLAVQDDPRSRLARGAVLHCPYEQPSGAGAWARWKGREQAI